MRERYAKQQSFSHALNFSFPYNAAERMTQLRDEDTKVRDSLVSFFIVKKKMYMA